MTTTITTTTTTTTTNVLTVSNQDVSNDDDEGDERYQGEDGLKQNSRVDAVERIATLFRGNIRQRYEYIYKHF